MRRRHFSGWLGLLAALISGVMAPGCGEADGGGGQAPRAAGGKVAPIRFKNFAYTDREGIGTEAFRMLIPADWKFAGGIVWALDNPGTPARAAFTVADPAGEARFEVFPSQPFFWSNNQMLLSMFPIGSRYFGNEVRPPLGPVEALKEIVLPRFRAGVILKIAKEETLPDLARAVGAGKPQAELPTSAQGGKVRIEYIRDGKPMEEEIFAVVESVSFPIQTMYGPALNINWRVDYIFSFAAPQGKLESLNPVFQTMIRSFRIDPRWLSKYSQLVEYLIQAQIKQIRNVGELSRIISRTSDEISEMSMQAYRERQAVNDRIAENFSRHIRGVDAYRDPDGETVELPGGYRRAWTNSLGEYILSEEQDYDPNPGSSQNWREITRAE